jgi:peroxiredoxin
MRYILKSAFFALLLPLLVIGRMTGDDHTVKTADELWASYNELDTELDASSDSSRNAKQCSLILNNLTDLIKLYPSDKRYWLARLYKVCFEIFQGQRSGKTQQQLNAELEQIVDSKEAPDEIVAEADLLLIKPTFSALIHSVNPTESTWDSAENLISGFQQRCKNGPKSKEIAVAMWQSELKALMSCGNRARYKSVIDHLRASNDSEFTDLVVNASKLEDIVGVPLVLKAGAIDLSKLRGHVVLLVFWATWCGPCVAEIPDELEVYKQYHPQGLEIVGISQDRKQEDLDQFVHDHGMSWPQFLDADSKVSSQFGIDEIPQYWLIDKNGVVVDADPRHKLKENIEKLVVGGANSSE